MNLDPAAILAVISEQAIRIAEGNARVAELEAENTALREALENKPA